VSSEPGAAQSGGGAASRSSTPYVIGSKPSSPPSPASWPSQRRSVTHSRAGTVSPVSSTTAASRSTPTSSNAPSVRSRWGIHCATLRQVSVNIGSMSSPNVRHGRPFRANAVFTRSVFKSAARIWCGAPRTTCSAASAPVCIKRRTMWLPTPRCFAASVSVNHSPSFSADR
jgi:hypothetical protein